MRQIIKPNCEYMKRTHKIQSIDFPAVIEKVKMAGMWAIFRGRMK